MRMFRLGFVLLLSVVTPTTLTLASRQFLTDKREVAEYCIGEDFQPRCSGNDVIVMLRARYGRMKIGRCVKREPGFEPMLRDPRYLGCSADVLRTLGTLCSGRSECIVRVNDQTFNNSKPCYDNLKMYLVASYICVNVAAETRYCTVSVSSGPQHIVDFGRTRQHSETLGSSRCGDKSRPWTIDALNGQRIAVSLIDFTTQDGASSSSSEKRRRDDSERRCEVTYGDVIDKAARNNISICGRDVQDGRLRRLYVSQSNLLHIVFTTAASSDHHQQQQQQHNFIIHVEAVGCSDLVSPSDGAWLRREGDDVVVGCYTSRQSWHLRCVDGVWTGTVGLCPQHHYQHDQHQLAGAVIGEEQQQQRTPNYADSNFAMLSIVAVSCSGVALCLLVICVGVACLRRPRQMRTIATDDLGHLSVCHAASRGFAVQRRLCGSRQNRQAKNAKSSVDVERLKPLNGSVDSYSVNLSATNDDVNLQWHQQQHQQLVM